MWISKVQPTTRYFRVHYPGHEFVFRTHICHGLRHQNSIVPTCWPANLDSIFSKACQECAHSVLSQGPQIQVLRTQLPKHRNACAVFPSSIPLSRSLTRTFFARSIHKSRFHNGYFKMLQKYVKMIAIVLNCPGLIGMCTIVQETLVSRVVRRTHGPCCSDCFCGKKWQDPRVVLSHLQKAKLSSHGQAGC